MTSQTRIARSVYFPATVCVLALSVPVHAQLTSFPIDFSEHHNAGMVTNAPVGNVRLGGVLFEIPTSGPNYWDGFVAGGGPGERVIEWPVGQMGVREIHTLINTDWGTAGGPFAKIEFFGSEGAYYLKNLFSCEDIRDHSPNNGNCDTINGTTSINVWNNGLSGRARFIVDKQQINLPADFWDEVLDTIRITDAGEGDHHQRLRVSGVTCFDGSEYWPTDFSAFHNATVDTNSPVGNVHFGETWFDIPTEPFNYWSGWHAGGPGSEERVIEEILIDRCDVRTVYTLINTYWGTAGGPYAWIEFFGSDGAKYRKDLFSCDDIRDHSPNNGNCDTINGTTSINVWNNGLSGRARFIVDKQQINLPADFWDEVLVSVTITDAGHGEGHQRLMVMGLTVIAPLFGDPNCDGEINALDIEPFLLAMFDPDEYAIHYPDCDLMLADVNCDDVVNASDIEPFIDLLFP